MKKELSKEDSEMYLMVVTQGNKDDMFDLGYALGQRDLLKEQIARLEK